VEQRKDLWELVRQKLDKNNEPVIESPTNEESTNAIQEQKVTVRKDEVEDSTFSFDAVKEESKNEITIWLDGETGTPLGVITKKKRKKKGDD